MEGRDVARFARELRERIEGQGAAALERVDWAERFWRLGFRMDCGHSYEERYGIALHDVQGLRRELSRISFRHLYLPARMLYFVVRCSELG